MKKGYRYSASARVERFPELRSLFIYIGARTVKPYYVVRKVRGTGESYIHVYAYAVIQYVSASENDPYSTHPDANARTDCTRQLGGITAVT